MRPGKLAGCGIAITRPAQQAQALAALIAAAGGQPVLFPLLDIVALQDHAAFDAQAAMLDRFQWAFFISTNAVAFGWQRLQHLGAAFPPGLRCAAIGPATAQALQQAGIRNVLTPQQRYDSENLLASPALQDMRHQRCLIFRGLGGRELLAETLRARGAQVDFAECYRRINPSHDLTPLRRLWQNGQLQAIVLTSSEALRNLLALENDHDRAWLRQTRLFVNHQRIAELAEKNGWQVIVAEQPGDMGMLAALVQNWKP